jgi:hypothetical protein
MRRSAHTLAATAALVMFLTLVAPAAPTGVTIDPATRALGEKYGIVFQVDDLPKTPPTWKLAPLAKTDEAQMNVYLRLFREEFSKYPVAFVRATGLKRIILAKEMTVAGIDRGAIPDRPNRAVWYDPFHGQFDDMYKRHVVHHEYFHFADNVFQESAYLTDPYWASLNRPNFHYGKGGFTARGGDQFGVTNREAGFVNRYSTSGLEEDRAEIFASMWIPMEANILEQRSRSDAILKGKIHRMRAIVKYYSQEPRDPTEQRARQLFAAVRAKDLPQIDRVLADAGDGETLSARDWLGRTPLHWAVMIQDADQTRHLLELHADANAVDDDGWTPLHVAAFMGDLEMAKKLVEAGADPASKDKRGGTPGDWARIRGHAELASALRVASDNAVHTQSGTRAGAPTAPTTPRRR